MNTKDSAAPANRRRQHQELLLRRRRRRRKRILRRTLMTLMIVGLLLGIARFTHFPLIGNLWNRPLETIDIAIDAGHGGKDQGCSAENVLEKDLNLKIALKTQKLLEAHGYKVGMVRDDDTFVKLGSRSEYANQRNAKVFVSIHCNSSDSGEGSGIETYYAGEQFSDSRSLAELIQKNLILQTNAADRETKTADYAVIVHTTMPAALVEVGFLSDPDERNLLQKDSYQELLAQGIADGIISYLND